MMEQCKGQSSVLIPLSGIANQYINCVTFECMRCAPATKFSEKCQTCIHEDEDLETCECFIIHNIEINISNINLRMQNANAFLFVLLFNIMNSSFFIDVCHDPSKDLPVDECKLLLH
jgi:hypothetical protein